MSDPIPRQIVLCCDGTNNNLTGGDSDTNVVRLCQLLRQHGDARQQVFYDPGVGNPGELPGATVWDSINRYSERLAGLAFGRGVYENMAECYQFLMQHHQPGDELYIFGFSRGAFTARSVAGLVNMFGILQPHMVSMVPSLLHIYFSDRGGGGDSARRIARQATELFAEPHSRHVNIHFVGVWDTVASVGMPPSPSSSPPGPMSAASAFSMSGRRWRWTSTARSLRPGSTSTPMACTAPTRG